MFIVTTLKEEYILIFFSCLQQEQFLEIWYKCITCTCTLLNSN